MAAYLQRRGGSFAFRISVPHDLRQCLGQREIVLALPFDRHEATAQALELAAQAKRRFRELRRAMTFDDKLKASLKDARHGLKVAEVRDQHFDDLAHAHKQRIAEVREARQAANLETLKAKAESEALRTVLRVREPSAVVSATPSAPAAPKPKAPTLGKVVESFLDKYRQDKKPAMVKKHKPVLTMLVEVIGNKPVDELKQADLNDFFILLPKLPPRWRDTCDREKISIKALAKRKHAITFENRQNATADQIEAFLRDRAGVENFDWTPPSGAAGKWTCQEWNSAPTSDRHRTITATFEEVFEG
ncbi:MAG: phage tail protein [Rhodocyclaceae bacterium]|nr:phage tail protein [Rhodocyclaceae bacterium]